MLGSEEIDADWWLEFRRHARGFDATFTPAIIGFAAPLSNLSAVLDGTMPPLILLIPIAIAVVTWAFIWGLVIERFRTGGTSRPSALMRAGFAAMPRFLAISAAAVAAQLILYFTVHAVLFGVVFDALTATLTRERDAFVVRVALYAIFGVLIGSVTLVADYARISTGLGRPAPWATAIAFVRRRWSSAFALFLVTTIILGLALVVYGVGEAYGGSRVGGWRGVAIGQAFIWLRLVVRLVSIASAVRLFERWSEPGVPR
jgi:hypothetical protein